MTKFINLTIDGQSVSVPENTTVLEAAAQVGIDIPHLCYVKDTNEIGACRICVVEVKGRRNLPASCVLPVEEGMEIQTSSLKVLESRRMNVKLMLSDHPKDCLQCIRNQNCALQNIAYQLGVREGYSTDYEEKPLDNHGVIQRDPNKCILCRRCVAVCQNVQGTNILGALDRGIDTVVSPAWQNSLTETSCVYCGQCIQACPVGAIYERNDTQDVLKMLNSDNYAVVQVAPAIRAALGEELGMPPGTNVVGKMVTALKRLGFDKVFDTNFTADLTIMEEGHELLERLKENQLPLITSCSPGWVRFVEEYYPQLVSYLSSCKSPQQMFGALAKTYFAQVEDIDPQNIKTISIMPCTAKKYEASRSEMQASGFQDVDLVLTTRELAALIRQSGIQLSNLPESEFDTPMGLSSGASVLFGQSGGVMEAALRTLSLAYPDRVKAIEESEGTRIFIDDKEIKVKVVSGLQKAREILEQILDGECEADFIEVMACPGGCIAGGGQPIVIDTNERNDRVTARRETIKSIDDSAAIKGSHENPAVKTLYETFLNNPLSEISHKLLHTTYKNAKKQDVPE